MRLRHLLAAALLLSVSSVGTWAATEFALTMPPMVAEEDGGLDELTLDVSATGKSEFKFTGKGRGKATTFRSHLEYIHRVPLNGPWHFQFGVDYDRFDFGGTALRTLPTTLQAVSIPLGISYLVNGHVGFLAEIRPGFHFSHSVSRGAFDVPFNIGGGFPLIEGKLYGAWGVGTSILRRYPVIPVVGVIWLISDEWRLMGYVPEPKLVFDASEDLQIWFGGEIIVNSFKVGKMSRSHLSNTVVDYEEYRVGVGFDYKPAPNWTFTAAGGCAVFRSFDFWRAKESYNAEPAPFLRLQLSAAF